MPDENARELLLTEGLKGYLDAYSALTTFEREIQESAKSIMKKRFLELKSALDAGDLIADSIQDVGLEGREGVVAIGVQVPAPDTWGIRFGLKWGQYNLKTKVRPVYATCAVLPGSQHKLRILFKALTSAKQKSVAAVNLRSVAEWPYQVQMDIPIPSGCSASQFEQRLEDIFSAFLELMKATGGLKRGLSA